MAGEMENFCVLRLNAQTFPMLVDERELLAQAGLTIQEIEGDTEEEILAHAAEADAVMIVSAYLRTPVIQRLTRCRIISRLGTGVDKIDIDQATRQGIVVTNLPEFCTDEVADHTLALLLAAARQLNVLESEIRQGRRPHDLAGLHRLSKQTLGLIGFGRIGGAVARRARAFGLKVMACDPKLVPGTADAEGVIAVDLDTVLSRSDYLCLLCPLLPATRAMITIKELKRMKPSSVLINTARGELVNEDDLVTALKEGIIRYAALDVFGGINVFLPDGFATDHPLFSLKNVLLTPHVAALSEESQHESHIGGARAVVEVLSGAWPKHLVNPDVQPWFPSKRLQYLK